MRPNRVEIPQDRHHKPRIRRRHIAQNLLNHIFCPPVWVRQISPHLHRFHTNWTFLQAIHRRRRRKNYLSHPKFLHTFQQIDRPAHVHFVIFQWLLHALRHRLQPRKMHHRPKFPLSKNFRHRHLIPNVHLMEFRLHPCNFRNVVQHPNLAVVQVVQYLHLVPRLN